MAKIDFDLLYLLSENARMKLRDISQILKKSPQRLKYSFAALEREGLLSQPYCLFDYSYFGLLLFRVYFKGGYLGEAEKESIIQKLRANPYVLSIYELTGEFDLVAEIASPNPSKFNKELKKIVLSLPVLNDYKIILNLVTHSYPRNYLLDRQSFSSFPTEIIVGGDRERKSFNSNELAVIRNFLFAPRLRLASLAGQSRLNVKTVSSALKNLSHNKIIRGYKYILDTNQLGIHKFRLFLRLRSLALEREAQLLEYLLKTNEIVQASKTVGDWDLEIDIESLDKNHLRHLIMHFREEFKDVIEKFNLIEFYKYYQKSYLPRYLFEEEVQEKK